MSIYIFVYTKGRRGRCPETNGGRNNWGQTRPLWTMKKSQRGKHLSCSDSHLMGKRTAIRSEIQQYV